MDERRAPGHRLAASCPHCGTELVAASGVSTTGPPNADAVMICGICRGLGIFVDGPLGLAVRLPTPAEQDSIRRLGGVKAAMRALSETYDSWDAADLLDGADGGSGA